MTDYAKYFQGEEYKYGTSIEEIAENQKSLIESYEDNPRLAFFTFGEDPPTLAELFQNPSFMEDYLDPLLRPELIGEDKGLFGSGEGMGIPKDVTDFITDLQKYYGEDLSDQERLEKFYRDMGVEYQSTGNLGQDQRNAFNSFFVGDRAKLASSYAFLSRRATGEANPFKNIRTSIEGIESRKGTIEGLGAAFEKSGQDITDYGETMSKAKQNLASQFGTTGLVAAGGFEESLQNLESDYKKGIETLRDTRRANWQSIGAQLKKYAEADVTAVEDFYEATKAALAVQEADIETEMGAG